MQKKISLALQGSAPLTELIVQDNGIDIIAGSANQNLTALAPAQQQYIKMCVVQLAKNYDIVMIDMPFHILSPLWEDLGENLWVISPDKNVIISTLAACKNQQQPHLILNHQSKDFPLNQLYVFTKMLCPTCQITLL